MSSGSYWSPSAWGRGGAEVAWADPIDGLSANPALLVLAKGKNALGGDWGMLAKGIDRWSVGIADGKNKVVGGFRFDWIDEGRPTRHGYHAAGAYQTTYGAFGASIDVYSFDDLAKNNGWHFTNTVGIYAPVAYGISIGIRGRSFLDTASDTVLPPEIAAGLAYRYENVFIFQFQADRRFEIPNQDFNYSFGVDLMSKKFFAARSGFHWADKKEDQLWTVGAGIEAPRSSISAYFSRHLHGSDKNGFGFRMTFTM